MSITTTIKTIQDIMRQDAGVDGDAQRISQLTWLLFLKIFDDREQELELNGAYQSPIPAPLRWRAWAANAEGMTGDALLQFIDGQLFPTLKDESKMLSNGNARARVVYDVFADSYNYMKSGTLLRQVVNKINEIDFTSSQDRHLFNDLYEKILRDLQSAGNAGEYYTPRAVTQFMVDMTDPQLGQIVLDPACGTAGFLVCALEHIRRKYVRDDADRAQLQNSIRGIEKKPLPHLLATTNLILHDIEIPQIIHDNALTRRPYKDYDNADQVDVILTNPPFGGMEEPGVDQNFPQNFQTKETADLFLALIVKLLKDGGKGAIVLPDGSLFGEGVKTRLKEHLLTTCNLHTIVRLPKGVFNPYTGINTNLLFFTKGAPTSEVWYFEHPLPPDRKNYSKTRPIDIKEFDLEKAWWDNRVENEYAWRVSIENIKARNYNLDCKNPNTTDAAHGDPAQMLAAYQTHQAEIAALRAALKAELEQALQ
ncbi:MAG: putative type I restriction enzymeP M protein [Anaerolineae bacterium]|nr:putative type I restriction enzymeP M protein [Anaerolineae bacterium]